MKFIHLKIPLGLYFLNSAKYFTNYIVCICVNVYPKLINNSSFAPNLLLFTKSGGLVKNDRDSL